MEEKAKALMEKIQVLCVKYYYEKEDIVLKEARNMLTEIQDFCYAILHSDFSEINAEDGQVLRGYTVQLLEDYIGALECQDTVWMLDTLDAGLRELLEIFINTETIAG